MRSKNVVLRSPSVPATKTSSSSSNSKHPPMWQTNKDMPLRRDIMQKLMLVMQQKSYFVLQRRGFLSGLMLNRNTSTNTYPLSTEEWVEHLPIIVRRLELALYIRAASVQEYLNVSTLQRRVQYLVLSWRHKTPTSARRAAQRPAATTTLHAFVQKPESDFLLDNQMDLIRHVFSFLDGSEVLKARTINKFAATNLPVCVQHLTLDTQQLAAGGNESIPHYTSLRSLRIVPMKEADGKDNNSEVVIRELALALRKKKNLHLNLLVLNNVFINTNIINAARSLLYTLSLNSCPVLETLEVADNSIGDAASMDLLRFLSVSCRLKCLDLRRNFFGEKAFSMLSIALRNSRIALERLMLGGNIAGDYSIEVISALMETGKLKGLQRFSLEDNFITSLGVARLATALNRDSCPNLKELYLGNNSIQNQEIYRSFCRIK